MRELFFVLTLSLVVFISCNNSDKYSEKTTENENIVQVDTTIAPVKKVEVDSYGFPYDSSMVSDFRVEPNESFYEILDRYDVSPRRSIRSPIKRRTL
ncbi:MAG: hypothetical protein U5K69_02860 [Balneolaceae bacterium]|nr:hypothetical protein [Balneolaceae bacterium]